MGYTRGIVIQYQYHGAGIGTVLLIVENHLYPIPDKYQNSTCKEAIRNQEISENIRKSEAEDNRNIQGVPYKPSICKNLSQAHI